MRYMVYKFDYKPNDCISFAIDYMCLQASKLWNQANYERTEYKKIGLESMPNWYDQKKSFKENAHYKMLMAQSSQDLLKDLDSAWKSYFELVKKNEKANPPSYKKYGQHTSVKYAHHSFKILSNNIIRFSLPSKLKQIVLDKFNVKLDYFYIKLNLKIDDAKYISIAHIKPGMFRICISYKCRDIKYKEDNGRHIGIDLGVSNLFAVYDNNGNSFIINGSSFKNTIYYFSKKIAHYQKILKASYLKNNPKKAFSSKRIAELYRTKAARINYLLHASTKKIVDYCQENSVTVVAIGDMKGIKNNCSFGHVSKQQFYSVAFARIVELLQYKLDNIGVKLVKVNEAYSSQCPPYSLNVSSTYGSKYRRKKRGLYKYKKKIYNADSLGAFNILRIYYQNKKEPVSSLDYRSISNPENICIPVTMDFFDYFPCLDVKRLVGVAGRNYPSGDEFIAFIKNALSFSAEV